MKTNKWWLTLFVTPAALLFLLIFGQSIVVLVGSSFTDWAIGRQPAFVGLANYIDILKDRDFAKAFANTILWIVLQSTVHVCIGVLVALILARQKFYWKFVRTVYMIPNIVSAAAVGLMFSILLNPQFGLVNKLIQQLGFTDFSQNWFMSKNTAFWSVTIIWLPYAATITILTLAEINAIDSSVFEAASVDGASELQVNFRIILPMLRNIIGTCTVLAATSMLQKFDVIMMTTQGGPLNYTLNLPLYIYQTALTNNDFARANTAGVYLIIMGFITVLFINRVFRMGKSDL